MFGSLYQQFKVDGVFDKIVGGRISRVDDFSHAVDGEDRLAMQPRKKAKTSPGLAAELGRATAIDEGVLLSAARRLGRR